MFSGMKASRITTAYAFAEGHVFAIVDPNRTLFEFVSRKDDIVLLRCAEPPFLTQQMSGSEFDELVAGGKIDPRYAENPKIRRVSSPVGRDPSFDDLPEFDRDAVDFYYKLCVNIYERYRSRRITLTDESLKKNLPQIAFEIMFSGQHEPEEDIWNSGVRKRGSKKVSPVASRTIAARKRKLAFDLPSPSSIRDYIRRLVEEEWDPRAIRDHRRGRSGNSSPRIPVCVSNVMLPWVNAFGCSSRPTAAILYKLMLGSEDLRLINESRVSRKKRRIPVDDFKTFASENAVRLKAGLTPLVPPSKRTFEREIKKLDQYQVVRAREGNNAARKRFRIGGRREGALAAGERVAIDCWRIQQIQLRRLSEVWVGLTEEEIEKLVKLRLGLCVAICEASKVVLGMRLFVNPTEEVAIETLEMVCRNKSWIAEAVGCSSSWSHAITPETVPTDGGAEFIGARVRTVVTDIGSTNEVGPPRSSRTPRGVIETIFSHRG